PGSLGGSPIIKIPAGQPFAGRLAGGGERGQVNGTSTYGGGYPSSYNYTGADVRGRGFPFYFWPIAFGTTGTLSYFYHDEYGLPTNESRPGGAQQMATYYISSADGKGNHTVRVIADRNSLLDIVNILDGFISRGRKSGDCWSKAVRPINGVIAPFDAAHVKPEQVWTYIRANSAALSIDEYNNSAVFNSKDRAASGSALPAFIDHGAVTCITGRLVTNIPL
ncbi:hypothetical protein BDZ89DRAFT_918257, partial [Hymenopellis radicata]